MSTPMRLGILVVAIAAVGVAVAGGNDLEGFGGVRGVEPASAPLVSSSVQERLAGAARRHGYPARPAGCLEQLRAFDYGTGSANADVRNHSRHQQVGVADERARHALMFGIAISEFGATLSAEQSAILQARAPSLGRAFICSGVQGGTS